MAAGDSVLTSTPSNKNDAVDGPRAEALASYLRWLEGRPLATRSREAYGHQVGRYLAWLGDRSPVDGDPLADEAARDWAVRGGSPIVAGQHAVCRHNRAVVGD